MSVVYPVFLWGLLGLLIPVIIHLFQFKRFRTTYFSNVAFLKSVYEDQRAQSELKRYLLLASRIAAILFLVLAFAQPYWTKTTDIARQSPKDQWSIFIDNSLSMGGEGQSGRLIDEAKQHALRTVQSLPSNTRFQIQEQSFSGSNQLLLNQAEAIEHIQQIQISPSSRTLSQVLERNKSAWNKSNHKGVNHLIISDFQSQGVDLEAIQLDSSERLMVLPVPPRTTSNAWIDSIWIEEPYLQAGKRVGVHVKAKRSENYATAETTMKLLLNDKEQSFFTIQWEDQTEVDTVVDLTLPAESVAKVVLAMNDAGIPYDDTAFVALNLRTNLRVLEINEAQELTWVGRAFRTDSFFVYQQIHPAQVKSDDLANADAILYTAKKSPTSGLTQQLLTQLNAGKNVTLFAHPEANYADWNQQVMALGGPIVMAWDTQRITMQSVNTNQPFFSDVFRSEPEKVKWPDFFGASAVQLPTDGYGFELLRSLQGTSLLTRKPIGNGQLFIAGFSPEKTFTSLVEHPIFIPVLFRMALQQQTTRSLFHTIGKHSWITTSLNPGNENTFTIASEQISFIPQAIPQPEGWRLEQLDAIQHPGFYSITVPNEPKQEWTAFNFDRKESSTAYVNPEQLATQAANTGILLDILSASPESLEQDLSSINELDTLWRLCLIITLLFLTAEVLITRFIP